MGQIKKVTILLTPSIMMEEKKWYAVYTKPGCEKKVSELLSRKGIENYCPQNKVLKHWSDRRKIMHAPLFPSYVFVRIFIEEQLIIRQTNGILNFVFWLNKPAVIRDKEIEIIKRFLNEHSFVRLEKVDVHFNDVVKINSAPLIEQEGKVVSINSKIVKMILPTLGYTLCAEIDTANVKVIKENHAYLREPLI
jgi:transcription termination/antitermination protein NusG